VLSDSGKKSIQIAHMNQFFTVSDMWSGCQVAHNTYYARYTNGLRMKRF